MKFRADNKKLQQYLLHAELIKVVESGDDYEIAEIKRGLDCGIVVISSNKVVESYMEDRNKWAKIKKDDGSHVDQIKENMMFFYNK